MSEKSKLRDLASPEDIQEQELMLMDIQTRHADRMQELGIAHKARDLTPAEQLNELSRPYVAMSRHEDNEGTMTDRISIRFATSKLPAQGNGYVTSHSTVIPVVDVYPDSLALIPETDFSLEQAEASIEMAAELKRAKEVGMLPQLSFAGTSVNILDPRTHMMGLPPLKKSINA